MYTRILKKFEQTPSRKCPKINLLCIPYMCDLSKSENNSVITCATDVMAILTETAGVETSTNRLQLNQYITGMINVK